MCPTCLLALGVRTDEAPTPFPTVNPSNDHGTIMPDQVSGKRGNSFAGDRIGRYQLLEEIGEGGFGTVWMAEQQEPVRRRVALKIIKLGMDTKQVVARFEAERQALALMDHQNIARVFDGGTTDRGRPFFVMELVRGIPLTTYCDARKLSARERLELFLEVCHAVQHAHQKGIIHRDLKPSNILVTEQDGRAIPKVIDFGIAKATGADLTDKTLFTQFNQMIGTPAYMSPEQAGLGSLDVDTRTDIYAMGVLLYELLTGRTPFDPQKLREAGYEAMLKTIREVEPPKPSTRLGTLKLEDLTVIAGLRGENPQRLQRLIRGDLEWIVLKALEKDRARRYETANGLAADLRRYLNQEPVAAVPPTLRYRVTKFTRKHRAALASMAAFLLLMIAGIVATTLEAVRATTNAREAEGQRDKARAAQKIADLNAAEARRGLYVAQIRLAHQAWDDGNLEQAEKFLDAAVPAAGQEDLRDFEWRYLRKLCRDESRSTFTDPNFKLPLFRYGVPYPFGAGGDGQTLMVATSNMIKWLDAQNLREVRTLNFDASPISQLAVAPNQPGRVVCRINDKISVLSPAGEPLRGGLEDHHPSYGIACSWDGALVASIGLSNTLRILEVKTGMQSGPELSLGEAVASLAFSPDGKHLVCGTFDTAILIIELPELKAVKKLTNHTARVGCLAFDRPGKRLASGSYDSHIRVWSFPDGQEIADLAGHRGHIGDLAFSPDGQQLASGGGDHTIRLWTLARPAAPLFLHGHLGAVSAIFFSPDGKELYTRSDDGTVKLWHLPSAQSTNILRHSHWLSRLAFSPKAPILAVEDYHTQATVLWNLTSRQRITNLAQHSAEFGSGAVAFSPDGDLLATAGQDGIAQVWNLSTGKMIFEFPKERGAAYLAFHPFQPILAVVYDDIRFWDLRTGGQTNLVEKPPSQRARAIAFSPDGERIAIGDRDGGVSIWSLATRRKLHAFQAHSAGSGIYAICFSHDGALLASGATDNLIALYDLRRRPLISQLAGHTGLVGALAFSPDGKSLVSTSWDGTAKFWYIANHQLALTLVQEGGPLTSVSFSPDGNLLATCGSDGTVRLWPAVSWEEIGVSKTNRTRKLQAP